MSNDDERRQPRSTFDVQVCRVCSCTDDQACEGGCSWSDVPGVCSNCVATVLAEVVAERARQDEKWGEQNHPDVDQVLMTRAGGCRPERMAEHYEIPTAARAKFITDTAAARGQSTFAAILIEEVAEAVEAATLNDGNLRTELIQVAAVATQWVEAIDRRTADAAPAGETATKRPIATHRVTWVGDEPTFHCGGDQESACRNYPSCGCELWGECCRAEHQAEPQAECWQLTWLNAQDVNDSYAPDDGWAWGDPVPIRDGVIETTWQGDYLSWRYAAPTGESESADERCGAETHSWDYFRPEQIDAYWIRCDKRGPHDEHEHADTGAIWVESLKEGGDQR